MLDLMHLMRMKELRREAERERLANAARRAAVRARNQPMRLLRRR